MNAQMDLINAALGLVVILDLTILATERHLQRLRILAFQGAIMGLMPVLAHTEGYSDPYLIFVGLLFLFIKAVGLPYLLFRTYSHLPQLRSVAPYIGSTGCIICGLLGFALSLWLTAKLGIASNPMFSVFFPAAFTTIIAGLLLIVTRKNALTQVLGYLTMENGIYLLGVPMADANAVWLEMTILLDILVGVFVMGIAIYHIHREFETTSVDQFSTLKG